MLTDFLQSVVTLQSKLVTCRIYRHPVIQSQVVELPLKHELVIHSPRRVGKDFVHPATVSNYLTSFCVEYLRWVLALICSTKVI
jgi:hypothetical protein